MGLKIRRTTGREPSSDVTIENLSFDSVSPADSRQHLVQGAAQRAQLFGVEQLRKDEVALVVVGGLLVGWGQRRRRQHHAWFLLPPEG